MDPAKPLYGPDGVQLPPPKAPIGKSLTRGAKAVLLSSLAILAAAAAALSNIDSIKSALFSTDAKPVPPLIGIQELQTAESRFTFRLVEGPSACDNLLDCFRKENRGLFEHLEDLKRKAQSGSIGPGATYIAGTQGVGKSFVFRELGFGAAIATNIDLREACNSTGDDLASIDGKRAFNVLPASEDLNLTDYLASIQGDKKPIVMIDGLDEVSNTTAQRVLAQIENLVREWSNQKQHFVVFGRPEGFWEWLSNDRQRRPANVTPSPFFLKGPLIRTTGDIEFRCNEFYRDKYKEDAPPQFVEDVQSRVRAFPFLLNTMGPLAVTNYVMEESVARVKRSNVQETAESIRAGLFSDLIDRNKKSHSRPSKDDDVYLELLERAAVFPIEKGRGIDSDGFFEVHASDFVEFFDEDKTKRQVRLRDLLNRSGLILLDPSELTRTRYRFDPHWMHMHLIERWNQRNHPGHVYRS